MTAINALLVSAAAAGWLLLVVRTTLVAARMLQIEEYENARFVDWGRTRDWLLHTSVLLGSACAAVALLLAVPLRQQGVPIVAAGWLVSGLVAHATWRWIAAKRELVLTARMRRLLAATAVIVVLAGLAVSLVMLLVAPLAGGLLALLTAAAITALPLLALTLANLAMRPVEAAVRNHYLARARRRLSEIDPLVIAVAGSYGKTSTKHILAQLLAGDDVLPTRKSFNTLMGVSRVVNEDLRPEHRVFIVEMDAYAKGEIAAICDLVHARYAVLTAVGPQHLERFGTLSAVSDALYESVASLPPDGAAIIHVGDEGGVALARRAAGEQRNVVRYALSGVTDEVDVIAAGVRISSHGTAFTWRWPARRLERTVVVPLLGRHQALNVSAALAMVELLGHSLDAAVQAAGKLHPVEHRLEPLRTGGPVTVIDDSYNANPVGVHEGLDVLATFDGGSKILVTPGLVELGSVEDEENRRYGEHAARVCDHVIVAAARPAASLLAGLQEGGMRADRIHRVRDLQETTALIGRIARPGDVVLFANDLPDTYLPGPGKRTAVTMAGAGG